MKEVLNELALFAGAGGGLLASKLEGNRIVCYVEWNDYCVEVLKARIRDGYLDDAPIWDDCNTFDGKPWVGRVDIVSAGFPCQPFSSAGKGLAEIDPRNGWPAVKRILGEVRPAFAFLENVPGLVSKPYIRRIFGDLAEIGYAAEWGIVSAAAVGALHKRERLWIVAYANCSAWSLAAISGESKDSIQFDRDGLPQLVANTHKSGYENLHTLSEDGEFISGGSSSDVSDTQKGWKPFNQPVWTKTRGSCSNSLWDIEPEFGRVANGVAHRVDRLEAIGNGQVPAVARAAWELLIKRIK